MHRYIPCAACWWPKAPKPPVIGAAASDAQAAVGVCWPVHTGQGRDARRAVPRRAHDCRRQYHRRLRVVSKCALREGHKENGAPRSSSDAPASVLPCWQITAPPACAILPQMNRQLMYSVVKPSFIHYISHKVSRKNSTQLVTSTFKSVWEERNPELELLFHSDRGAQYTSHRFQELLRNHAAVQSFEFWKALR